MRYKFELWNYGNYDFLEAEKHLNEMAEKGWSYKGKTIIFNGIAVYEKTEQAYQTQFAVDTFVRENKERELEYYQLMKESGWEIIQPESRRAQKVFQASKTSGVAIPYNDQESKMEIVSASLAESKEEFKRVFWSIIVLLLCYFLRGIADEVDLKVIGGAVMSYCGLMIIITLINATSFAYRHKQMNSGKVLNRTTIEKKISILAETLFNGKYIFLFFLFIYFTTVSLVAGLNEEPMVRRSVLLLTVALMCLAIMVIRMIHLAMKERENVVERLDNIIRVGLMTYIVFSQLDIALG
ncbi:hypothetical protein M2140_001509 [Clostridiales Family XIII bacterium PM5-7]